MKVKRLVYGLIGLSVLGLLLAGYSLLHKSGFTEGAVCNINETFSCDIVNQGPYSEIAGIPVALIGVVGYVFLLLASLLKLRTMEDRTLSRFLLLASSGGLLFALYLTGIEAFVLQAWCLLCLGSQAVIAALWVVSVRLYQLERPGV